MALMHLLLLALVTFLSIVARFKNSHYKIELSNDIFIGRRQRDPSVKPLRVDNRTDTINSFLPNIFFSKDIAVPVPRSINFENVSKVDDTIRLDPIEGCIPSGACRGIDVETIPYIIDHVSPNFQTDYKLFDTHRIEKCLAGLRIVMLGDSTMGETFHDFAILLSGIGKNKTELDRYIEYAAIKSDHEHSLWTYELPNGVDVNFHCCRRNISLVQSSRGLNILYRFIGHYKLEENNFGIRTLLSPEFRDELYCLLGVSSSGCAPPDIVIINSGLHDRYHSNVTFEDTLGRLLKVIKYQLIKNSLKRTRVLWKGGFVDPLVPSPPYRADLDSLAAKVVHAVGFSYVNMTRVITKYIPRLYTAPFQLYTPDRIHYGSIGRARNLLISGTVSMLTTQRMLQEICSTEHGKVSTAMHPGVRKYKTRSVHKSGMKQSSISSEGSSSNKRRSIKKKSSSSEEVGGWLKHFVNENYKIID